MSRRQPRSITIDEIDRRFGLGDSSYWFGTTWCPAVHARKEGGYGIRIVGRASQTGRNGHIVFDYFYLDADGTVTTAPRGYAKDYKPGRVVDIAEVSAQYAVPKPDARRIA